MKKTYIKPAMKVFELQGETSLLANSLRSLSTNLTGSDAFSLGAGSDGDARVKDNNFACDDDWDFEW